MALRGERAMGLVDFAIVGEDGLQMASRSEESS
jgi:hypothetical protein